jgi:RNA polymerase sigma-B factor
MPAPLSVAPSARPHHDLDGVSADDRAERTNHLFDRLDRATHDADEQSIRAEIVDLHLGLVRGIAARYRARGEDFDELYQAGCVGLVKAVNGFRADRGEFASYAATTISGEVKRHFRDRCWAIRPVRRIQELNARVYAMTASEEQRLGRSPTVDELSEALGEKCEDVREAIGTHGYYRLQSIHAPVSDGSLTVADQAACEEDGYGSVDAFATLHDAVAELGDQDREVLRMRFVADLTQREIAERIGTTQMQVSRILSRAYARLRDRIGPIEPLAS